VYPGQGSDQYLKPIALSKKAIATEFNKGSQGEIVLESNRDYTLKPRLYSSVQSQTFSVCYNCQTCTNACPVMQTYDNPHEALGLLPHQIMQGLSWGLTDLVMSSRMLWVCLGCYRCQEQCPQGVQITDVFYQLKNLAIKQVKSKLPAG
jgi:heterodisulfide reductase subunit C